MAVKGKKCQDLKMDWISSSFLDSFGMTTDENNENLSGGTGKKAKMEEKAVFDDSIVIKSEFESGLSKPKVLNSGNVWCEKYKPKNVDDLVINKNKVLEVKNWLKCSLFGDNFANVNRILLLTGPTGCGKTCTLNVLCQSLNINIIEWITPMDIAYGNINSEYDNTNIVRQRSVAQLFDEFLVRSSRYSSLLSLDDDEFSKKIVLVKDFPNVFLDKPELFHQILEKYYQNSNSNYHISPIVFVLSCPNITRELLSDDIQYQYHITNIKFNPVTETSIIKALNQILLLELKINPKIKMPCKDDLVNISDCCDGDLRSAILKLQFHLDNSVTTNYDKAFKMPKQISKGHERTKVKKSSSRKRKICEIDKDKKLDFFKLIGRVLYPKKEVIDTISSNSSLHNYKFVHSPDSIVDSFLVEPNKLVNMLHENYVSRFTNIKDVSVAASSLAVSDFLLSSSWEGKDLMTHYGLSTAVRSLMISNSAPAPNSWKPLTKSRIWFTENSRKENLNAVRRIFPDINSEKDVLLDVIPLLKRLDVNLKPEYDEIISKIAFYKH